MSLILVVKNRTEKEFEFMCNGQVHVIPAGAEVPLPSDIAQFGINKSTISFNPITGRAIRALALAGTPEAEEEIEARKPDSEVLDRSDEDGETKTIKFANPDISRTRISSPLGED